MCVRVCEAGVKYICVPLFVCKRMGVHTPQGMRGGQRTTPSVSPHLSSHLRQGLLSTTVYARLAGLNASGDPVSASQLPVGMGELISCLTWVLEKTTSGPPV